MYNIARKEVNNVQIELREQVMPAAGHEAKKQRPQDKKEGSLCQEDFASVMDLANNQISERHKQYPKHNPCLHPPVPDKVPDWQSLVVPNLHLIKGEKAWLAPGTPPGSGNNYHPTVGWQAGAKHLALVQAVNGEVPQGKTELPVLLQGVGMVGKEMVGPEPAYAAALNPAGTGQGKMPADLVLPAKLVDTEVMAVSKDVADMGFAQGETTSSLSARQAATTPVTYFNALSHQLVEKVKLLVSEGRSELEVQLKPEHLGRLKLNLTLEDGVITAKFVVENPKVGQIIETNMAHLRSVLTEAGLKFEQANVSYGGENFSGYNEDRPSFKSFIAGKETEDPLEPIQVPPFGIDLLA
jgi:hypothetical protein